MSVSWKIRRELCDAAGLLAFFLVAFGLPHSFLCHLLPWLFSFQSQFPGEFVLVVGSLAAGTVMGVWALYEGGRLNMQLFTYQYGLSPRMLREIFWLN